MTETVKVRHDPDAAVLDGLREAAGESAVLPPEELARYAVVGVAPRAVVAPDSVEGVARTLALCAAHGWPVEPAGAASWLFAGARPAVPPVVVTTTRLRRVREYEPANLVVGVEAGLPLAALADELAGQRQTIPLDPPAASDATVGAAIALASAGPLRAAHGTPRDMVLGVEIVAGDGRLLHFGGRVVKNVAGYDFVRLLVGSRGAFGLLTSVFLRLRGTPDLDTTTVIPASTADGALGLAARIREGLSPDALEVVGPGLAAHVLPDHAAGDAWAVLVRLRGSEAAVAEAAESLAVITGAAPAPLPAEAGAVAWQTVSRAEAGAPLCIRLAGLPSRLPQTTAAAQRLTAASGAGGRDGWHLAVHAADGIVRCWPAGEPDEESIARLAQALPPLAAELAATGGTVTWPVWPARAGAPPAPPAGAGADTRRRLLTELKARFDPAGILSPGRHVSDL